MYKREYVKKVFMNIVVVALLMLMQPLMSNDRLLLIDTGFNDEYTYHNFFLIAQSVGFKLDYKQFYDVQESDLNDYTCIIFSLDGNFVNNYFEQQKPLHVSTSPVVQKIVSLMHSFKQQKNKLLGVMLPSKMANSAKASFEHALMICMECLSLNDAMKKSLATFLQDIMQSDTIRSSDYHTTLLTKKDESTCCRRAKPIRNNTTNKITNSIISGFLPLKHIPQAPPLAWYGSNTKSNSHFFVTKKSLVTFADIGENFIYNPLDFSLRIDRLNELQQLLFELYQAALLGKLSKISDFQKPCLPQQFTQDFILRKKKQYSAQRMEHVNKKLYDWVNSELIWCGWANLGPYEGKETNVAQSLLTSHLNLLWLQLNPELFLSVNGTLNKEKDKFFNRIRSFTKALQEASLKSGEKIPHIFVGTEITGNFANKPVKNPVVDAYGHVYTKIPSPFDFKNLWQTEVLDVFDRMCAHWPVISNSIPLRGIFFDFEMYHAQDQAAHYEPIMDFSDLAWNIYCKETKQLFLNKIKDVDNRIAYLMNNKKCGDYFDQLKKQAFLIGRKIKDHIKRKLPNALIAVYDIHLPHAWFYKGMLEGLSTPQEPVILATFNIDFYSHYEWLIKNKIYAYHLPVLLLSKFKKLADFDYIEQIAQFHDGMWFNRISRLEESRDLINVEVTPLPTPLVVKKMGEHIKHMQKIYQVPCVCF